MFFYSDTEPKGPSKLNVWEMDGTHMYMHHFSNLMYLEFMAKNGTLVEKFQAEKEIKICNRKMEFWSKHPLFDKTECEKRKLKELKKWSV